MKTWKEFNRFHANKNFYGCVAADGTWFDSAENYSVAIYFCICHNGEHADSKEDEVKWMATTGKELGLSIIHSSMLERMYEKGLLK